MKKENNLLDFQIDKEAYVIKVERVFSAELPLVWKAWTDANILDQWWAPEGYLSTTKSLDFREGGKRHYRMQGPEDFEMWGITSYNQINIFDSFGGNEYSSNERGEISGELPQSKYLIRFYSLDHDTKIVHHTSYESLEDLKQSLDYGFKEGMEGAFARLDAFFSLQKL